MKAERVRITAAVAVVLLLVFFFLPLPVSRVRGKAVVQLQFEAMTPVPVPVSGGTLDRLNVRNGELVEVNQVLAQFQNPQKETELQEAKTQAEVLREQIRTLKELADKTNDAQEKARLDRERATKEHARNHLLQTEIPALTNAIKELEIRAPRTGVVTGLPPIDEVGKYWSVDRDQERSFCTVGDPERIGGPARLRVLMPVAPANYRILKDDLAVLKDLPVTVRIQGLGGRTWKGRISQLPEAEARTVPPHLTSKHGGDLAVKPSSNPNEHVPQSEQYLVGIDLIDPDPAICPGALAQVKVHCQWQTCAWWVWHTINATFDLALI